MFNNADSGVLAENYNNKGSTAELKLDDYNEKEKLQLRQFIDLMQISQYLDTVQTNWEENSTEVNKVKYGQGGNRRYDRRPERG